MASIVPLLRARRPRHAGERSALVLAVCLQRLADQAAGVNP
jgi:hypothetical protein